MEQSPPNLKPYVVICAYDQGGLEREAAKLYAQGYEATGGVSVGDRDGRLFQAFTLKRKLQQQPEIKLREPNGRRRAV